MEIVPEASKLTYTIVEVLELYSESWSYFKSMWNVVDMLIILISLGSLAFSVYRFKYIANKFEEYIQHPNEYISFDLLAFWDEQHNNFVAICVFLVWIKIFKYISFNKTMLQFCITLKRVSRNMFLAIINDTYSEVKSENVASDIHIGTYIKAKWHQMIEYAARFVPFLRNKITAASQNINETDTFENGQYNEEMDNFRKQSVLFEEIFLSVDDDTLASLLNGMNDRIISLEHSIEQISGKFDRMLEGNNQS
ncbi:Polycystic kidney disease 2-like 1 protein [Pseudolycoriella hygida]|uniref:Polycystic kidney disease 2-like 1 protein n=1 Tax=Pseudolycoriella hygida TaxID=35572 RepID=A0A9Q0MYA0_9DIPT|nr:Polycystic kidney disease 2-like 1 protein [Pseudolycoriella hygida]